MNLNQALQIAEEIKGWLKSCCKQIEIVGSVKRQKPEVNDIELLCIPAFSQDIFETGLEDMLDIGIRRLILGKYLGYRLNKKRCKVYGPKNKLLIHTASGFPVDIFSTDEACWPMAMVIRTGPKESNIRIAMAAKKKVWRMNAYGSGFTRGDGGKIVCKSEREVFEAVGLLYLKPEER